MKILFNIPRLMVPYALLRIDNNKAFQNGIESFYTHSNILCKQRQEEFEKRERWALENKKLYLVHKAPASVGFRRYNWYTTLSLSLKGWFQTQTLDKCFGWKALAIALRPKLKVSTKKWIITLHFKLIPKIIANKYILGSVTNYLVHVKINEKSIERALY